MENIKQSEEVVVQSSPEDISAEQTQLKENTEQPQQNTDDTDNEADPTEPTKQPQANAQIKAKQDEPTDGHPNGDAKPAENTTEEENASTKKPTTEQVANPNDELEAEPAEDNITEAKICDQDQLGAHKVCAKKSQQNDPLCESATNGEERPTEDTQANQEDAKAHNADPENVITDQPDAEKQDDRQDGQESQDVAQRNDYAAKSSQNEPTSQPKDNIQSVSVANDQEKQVEAKEKEPAEEALADQVKQQQPDQAGRTKIDQAVAMKNDDKETHQISEGTGAGNVKKARPASTQKDDAQAVQDFHEKIPVEVKEDSVKPAKNTESNEKDTLQANQPLSPRSSHRVSPTRSRLDSGDDAFPLVACLRCNNTFFVEKPGDVNWFTATGRKRNLKCAFTLIPAPLKPDLYQLIHIQSASYLAVMEEQPHIALCSLSHENFLFNFERVSGAKETKMRCKIKWKEQYLTAKEISMAPLYETTLKSAFVKENESADEIGMKLDDNAEEKTTASATAEPSELAAKNCLFSAQGTVLVFDNANEDDPDSQIFTLERVLDNDGGEFNLEFCAPDNAALGVTKQLKFFYGILLLWVLVSCVAFKYFFRRLPACDAHEFDQTGEILNQSVFDDMEEAVDFFRSHMTCDLMD